MPARQFDGLILRLQITLLSPGAQLERLQSQLQGIAQNLLEKADHVGVIYQQRSAKTRGGRASP